MLDDATPLFTQIAQRLAKEIADGVLAEGEQVPSTNELAAYPGSTRPPRPRAWGC